LIGLPARGGVEEIKIERDGEDGDLKEVKKAKGINAGGILVGTRKKDHEYGSGPDEEENIGRPRNLCGIGNKALVVGADGLSQGLERKGDGEEEPNLASVAGRALGDIERANGGEDDHGNVEGVGNKEAGDRGVNKFEVEDEQQGYEERGRNSESRKLAG